MGVGTWDTRNVVRRHCNLLKILWNILLGEYGGGSIRLVGRSAARYAKQPADRRPSTGGKLIAVRRPTRPSPKRGQMSADRRTTTALQTAGNRSQNGDRFRAAPSPRPNGALAVAKPEAVLTPQSTQSQLSGSNPFKSLVIALASADNSFRSASNRSGTDRPLAQRREHDHSLVRSTRR
jgi:hypothetical protein